MGCTQSKNSQGLADVDRSPPWTKGQSRNMITIVQALGPSTLENIQAALLILTEHQTAIKSAKGHVDKIELHNILALDAQYEPGVDNSDSEPDEDTDTPMPSTANDASGYAAAPSTHTGS